MSQSSRSDVKPSDVDRVLGYGLWRWLRPVGRQRLASALQELNTQFALVRLAAAESPCADIEPAHLKLEEAWKAAGRHNMYQAWDLIKQTERLLARCDEDHRRRQRMLVLLEEASDKLGGWRRSAVRKLAEAYPGGKAVVEIMAIMDQAAQNQQQKIELLKEGALAVIVLLVPTLAALLSYAWQSGYSWIFSGSLGPSDLGQVLVGSFLIGLLGSLMSVAFRLSQHDVGTAIPALRSATAVMFLRAAVGATASVPVVLLVYAGLINLGSDAPKMLLAACFLAGFSERWFVERLALAAGAGKPEPDRK